MNHPDKHIYKNNLSDHLFWDVDIDTLNLKEYARFIIERVINRGNYSDCLNLMSLYPASVIKKHIVNIKTFDKRTLSFLSMYYNIDKKEFRCYT